MSIVSSTGPLIALAKIDHLAVLEQLFGKVLIPTVVYRELFVKIGPEAARLDAALARFGTVEPPGALPPHVDLATMRLDDGEREAIALAYAHQAIVVIDDRRGRAVARRLSLTITGSVGVLIRAKEAGFIPAVRPLDGAEQTVTACSER